MSKTAELTQVATRIDDDLLRRLDERCATEDRPRAWVIEKALERHLEIQHEADRSTSEVAA